MPAGGGGGGQHRRHNRYHHPVHDWSASWPKALIPAGFCGVEDGCGGGPWPSRKYACSFCRREFRSAQALGGHMNVHRRDRARLRQASPPTTSSSSSATNAAAADSQECHPPITICSASLPPLPVVNKTSSGGPSTSLNSCSPCGPALALSRLTALSALSDPEVARPKQFSNHTSLNPCSPCGPAGLAFTRVTASSPVSNLGVLQPKHLSNHDDVGGPSTAAYTCSSSVGSTTCLQLMCSSPAAIHRVLQSTPESSCLDDHMASSTSSTAANGKHHHRRHCMEFDAAEDLQLASAITSCGPTQRSSLIAPLKQETHSKNSNSTLKPCADSSSGIQPYLLQRCHNYIYCTPRKDYVDDIVQHESATQDSLIKSPATGLDLELRLGRKLS